MNVPTYARYRVNNCALGVNKNNLVMIKCDYVLAQPVKTCFMYVAIIQGLLRTRLCIWVILHIDTELRRCCSHWDRSGDFHRQQIHWWVLAPSGDTLKNTPRPGSRLGGGVTL